MPDRPAIDPDVAFLTGIAHRYALALATLVVDRTLTSESDVPFEPFTAAFPSTQKLTAATFRDALGFEPTRRVDLRPATAFFDAVASSAADEGDVRAAQVYAVLETTMRRTLGRLTQVFVRGEGVVEVPFFLFGRLAGGPLVGLRSIAIET